MRLRISPRWLATALLAIALPCAAAAQERAIELDFECGVDHVNVVDVFDPDFDLGAKRAMLQALEAGAARGCAYDAYVVGTMLRHGRALPGNPLEKDVARAAMLIEAYARGGRITAFADLAEMALSEGDARSAMQWTQVYLHFAMRYATSNVSDFDRRGYNADLLVRATQAWHRARLKRSAIEPLMNEYLSRHRADVLAGLEAPSIASGSARKQTDTEAPPLRIKTRREVVQLDRALEIEPGYAVFLLEVQPSGRVSRIVPETFGPNVNTPAALRPMVADFEFEPFDGSEPYIARVPVVYGYAADGPSLRVPR